MRPRPLPEIGEHDLIWLAGLLEGEGCFLKSNMRRYRDGFRVRGDWPAFTEDELEAVA